MIKNDEVIKYINNLLPEERKILGEIRNQILTIAPDLEERLSRGVPFFYYQGKRAVGFRSSKKHLSFFIMDGNVLKDLHSDIEKLNYSSTVIKFSVQNPLPKTLIQKLVIARIAEIEKSQ